MTLRIALAGWLLLLQGAVHAQHPVVSSILEGVRIDSMMHWVNELTGEVPVDLGNGPVTLVSRHKYAEGNVLAEEYLAHKLEQFGYVPEVQAFSETGNNILATKVGSVYPEEVVVFCAHFDAMPGGFVAAPAADDNGSGCGALLEAARLFREIDFAYTIVFAFWDEEEQGLVGARHYAGAMAANDAPIRGVINMDAIAYDGNADTKARLHVRPVANSVEIGDTVLAVLDHYAIDIDLLYTNPGATYSDHAAFWTEGYGAVLIIEEFGADGNPFYHTPNDRVEHFDVPYYEKLAKLSIASAATLAEPTGAVQGVADHVAARGASLQAWPNPAAAGTTLWIDLREEGPVALSLVDAMGREVARPHSGWLPAGRHAIDLSLEGLPAGGYTLMARLDDRTVRSLRIMRIP